MAASAYVTQVYGGICVRLCSHSTIIFTFLDFNGKKVTAPDIPALMFLPSLDRSEVSRGAPLSPRSVSIVCERTPAAVRSDSPLIMNVSGSWRGGGGALT